MICRRSHPSLITSVLKPYLSYTAMAFAWGKLPHPKLTWAKFKRSLGKYQFLNLWHLLYTRLQPTQMSAIPTQFYTVTNYGFPAQPLHGTQLRCLIYRTSKGYLLFTIKYVFHLSRSCLYVIICLPFYLQFACFRICTWQGNLKLQLY